MTSAYVEASIRADRHLGLRDRRASSLDRVASERARGRQYWFYNGGRPAGGAITIDAPATDARATIWAAFKHDVRVYFYWHAVHWRHNSQKQGERNQNVWAETITFDNRKQANKSVDDQGYIHGDGVLLYPGEERLHPGEDRGIAGPIATIQLANFRRGLQDHQYLTLARALGLQAISSPTHWPPSSRACSRTPAIASASRRTATLSRTPGSDWAVQSRRACRPRA